ncbi:DUF4382 domain-containing protein [Thermosynechococcus sp. B3]|uniref:DUF4382 domain-containing protein n=1 Tax=unclassified Thermosynechococcus TaxID=2622553 RepID=UPI0025778C96|nr:MULTISPECIES: DUF4382 domain-containing protein [unclassified Thermosynechococcus]WJI25860.1 DUF4382 domain-containing protein [Thermosynechococcus sp. B1]WJI28387.1 DUF4382 domain-containing protein [Thermosynechococcus sp. B3]
MNLYQRLGIVTILSTALLASCAPASQKGTLLLYANGEERLQTGWTSKDGWKLEFDHVYLTLGTVTAYQTHPPFDPEAGDRPASEVTVVFSDPMTVDLVSDQRPLVGSAAAAVGHFNALQWQTLAPSLQLVGTAQRRDLKVPFDITLDQPLAFVCGDYIGDERKGIVTANSSAELEITLHFDHLFGDGAEPATAEINRDALGFDPFAAIATPERVTVDWTGLQQKLSPQEFQTLLTALRSLGHVGEGHCREVSS